MNEVVESLIQDGRYYHSHSRQVKQSHENIKITALKTTLRPTQFKKDDGELQEVLVLPIQVANHSQQTLIALLGHEWGGGEWPLTDLHIFMMYGQRGIRSNQDKLRPAYLLGEKNQAAKPTTLRPDDSIQLDLRVDWPGTGSVGGGTIMPKEKSATYTLWIILFFKIGNTIQYAISEELLIEVVSQ